jgi:hypothetical protein
MRAPALVLAAALLPQLAAASAGDGAFALRCERDMKPRIEVSAREVAFDVRNTLSARILNTRSADASAGNLLLGITSSESRTEILFDGPTLLNARATGECLAPRISVELSFSPVRVDVAREFRADSCPYATVYAHEMQHVQIYREQLPLAVDKVRAALDQRYGNKPLFAPAGQGMARLAADVDSWLRPLIKEELDRVKLLQAALDSPEETFRLSHACQGAVAAAIGGGLF